MRERATVLGAVVVAACAVVARAGDGDAKPARQGDLVVAPVARSWLTAYFRAPGWSFDAAGTSAERAQIGDKVLAVGRGFGGVATISLIVEKDQPHAASAEWRKRFTRGEGATFEVGDVACVDRTADMGGITQVNFNAMPVGAGWCFDLHVSAMAASADKCPLTRETFTEIVKSFRVALVRRGEVSDYPEDYLALMDAACRRMPDHLAWLAAEAKARPADFLPPLVEAETMRMLKAPDADCITPYTQALAILDKRKSPERAEQFVRAMAEDGLGLALGAAAKYPDAVVHFQRGYDAAWRIASPIRAGLSYNLACALARKGDAPKALDALRLAIEADEHYRASAAKDDDLASLRALPAFQLLTAGSGDAPPGAVYASVPKTGVRISLTIPGWQDHSEDGPRLAKQLGGRPILFGGIGDDFVAWVILEKDEPHAASAEWRKRIARGQGTAFEVGDVACVEADASFHAFFVAAGWSFDLQVGSGDTGGKAMSRAAFSEIVKSFRAYCLTAGTTSNYPPSVLECMNGVATRMPDAWLDWIKGEEKARPDDWVPSFVHGEALSFLRRPAAECVAPYTQTLALLEKKKDASRETVFVRMLCEDNLGGAMSESGDFAGAAVHAQRASDAARTIASGVHGHIAFRLARWQAKKGDAAKAVDALRAAIETMPGCRETAATEADFASLRDNPAFKALIGAPPAPK